MIKHTSAVFPMLVAIVGVLGAVTVANAATPAAGELSADGLGWGGITLGMPYEQAKSALRQRGCTLRFDLGMHHREDYIYSRTCGARDPKTGLDFILCGDKWENRVYSITVEVPSVDERDLLAALIRIHGEPTGRNGEDNFRFEKGAHRVAAFLPAGFARLTFANAEFEKRIAAQAEIDQGLAEGDQTAPTPLVEFFNRHQRAFAAALPACPKGWAVAEETPPGQVVETLTRYEDRPMPIAFSRTFVDRAREEQIERQQAAAAERHRPAMEAARATVEQRVEALRPRMEAVGARMQAAAERGDFAQVQKLQAELEALQAQLDAGATDAATAEVARDADPPPDLDSRCVVTVTTYDFYTDVFGTGGEGRAWRQESPVAGDIPVFWADRPGDPGPDLKGSLYAFVGPVECRLAGNGFTIRRPDLKRIPRMGVACICVRVTAGTRARARRMLEQVAWQQLRALVTPVRK